MCTDTLFHTSHLSLHKGGRMCIVSDPTLCLMLFYSDVFTVTLLSCVYCVGWTFGKFAQFAWSTLYMSSAVGAATDLRNTTVSPPAMVS